MMQNNPRAAAAASLLSWEQKGRYANLEVSAFLADSSMNEADRGLYTALFYGCVERLITLDYIISHLSSRPLQTIDRPTLCALRTGIYQLSFMDKIPPHAAVSETVNITPARSRGFVNALLRSHLRNKCRYSLPETSDPLERMSVEFSAPKELCAFLADGYGIENAGKLLNATNRNPHVTLRINTSRITAEEAISLLSKDGAKHCSLSPDMVEIDSAAHIVDGIREGLFFVQDPASRLCIRALDPKPGDFIIDTCAAPGGKTLSAALDMENRGRILACDLHENKLSLIRKTAAGLGISIVETEARDARTPDERFLGQADRVLCDAPCSGLGVIGKKPDIKYKSIDSISALPAIQFEILCGASRYVRSGGTLIYSTCTLNPKENEQVVFRFREAHPEFKPADFDLGPAGTSVDGMRTLIPFRDGCDGFFIAKMRKTI